MRNICSILFYSGAKIPLLNLLIGRSLALQIFQENCIVFFIAILYIYAREKTLILHAQSGNCQPTAICQ